MSLPGRRMVPDRELARTWQGVLGRLGFDLSAHNDPWLRPTQPAGFVGDTLLVHTPHAFHVEWLNRQFATVARRALSEELGRDVGLRFVATVDAAQPPATGPARESSIPVRLNRRYTLGTYLPLSGNQFALEACRAILAGAEDGAPDSPITIWGPPGIGKSHLLHATAACAIAAGRTVALLSGEEFADGYQQAIRANGVNDWQGRLRSADIFLLDELQYLAGREGTLKHLRLTIDAVRDCGGHVLLASEVHPATLNLPGPLISRIYGGLPAAIHPLDACERRAFVEHAARVARASLPVWCIERIGAISCGSPRVLQGGVNAAVNLDRYGDLDERNLDARLAAVVLQEAAATALDPAAILDRVGEYFEVTAQDLCGRSRKGRLPDARAAAIAALSGTGKSNAQIATLLGKRHPSTISPLVGKGNVLLDTTPALRQRLVG